MILFMYYRYCEKGQVNNAPYTMYIHICIFYGGLYPFPFRPKGHPTNFLCINYSIRPERA